MSVQFGLSQMACSNFRDEFSAKMLSPIYRLNKNTSIHQEEKGVLNRYWKDDGGI